MPQAPERRTVFSGRPLALRRRVIEVLERADGLTADQIAGFAYQPAGRPIYRDRPPPCSTSQVTTVRAALRRLVAKGRVTVLRRDRHRRFVFGLTAVRQRLDAVMTALPPSSEWGDR